MKFKEVTTVFSQPNKRSENIIATPLNQKGSEGRKPQVKQATPEPSDSL